MEPTIKTYLFTYFHRGESYEMAVDAFSPGDAVAKVGKMAEAVLEGELVERVIPIGGEDRVTVMSTQN